MCVTLSRRGNSTVAAGVPEETEGQDISVGKAGVQPANSLRIISVQDSIGAIGSGKTLQSDFLHHP